MNIHMPHKTEKSLKNIEKKGMQTIHMRKQLIRQKEGGENTFRPTKKISSKTPATWSELTPSQKARAKREKDTKGRVSKYRK